MKRCGHIVMVLIGLAGQLSAEMETRLHDFGGASPELVERQIRFLVPESQRVSMNPQAGKVIVVAEPHVQEKIAAMVREMARPTKLLDLWIRHNREIRQLTLQDGLPMNLPVASSPPMWVVSQGRARMAANQRNMPAAGSVLQVHVKLLREDPAVARLRVVPTVLFGSEPPYTVVRFDELGMDVLLKSGEYLELSEALEINSFYKQFLRSQVGETGSRPVSLLLSLRGLVEEESSKPESGQP